MANADAPVTANDRYDSLDLLRGLAVMAIFAVNIRAMLGPLNAMMDPRVFAGEHDLLIDRVLQYAVDGKWIATFAVLFGAGLALLHEKAVAAGADPRARIVRRQAWLTGFGLCHLVLIWPGDVLTTYGMLGFLAMLFTGRRSGTVLLWAILSFLVSALMVGGLSALFAFLPPDAASGDMLAEVARLRAEETEAMRGGIGEQIAWRAEFAAQALGNVFLVGPMVLAYMLAGVLLFRSGFLLARWRPLAYLAAALVCLPSAWAIDFLRVEAMGAWDAGYDGNYATDFFSWMWVGGTEGLLGALGYAALANLFVRLGGRLRAVSAAGRMAFTNYIACSLIGTTLAYGHAGALFGEVTLAQAMGIVGATWIAMLIWSPLWLAIFRFGPLEWLWRSLTYGRLQPILRAKPA